MERLLALDPIVAAAIVVVLTTVPIFVVSAFRKGEKSASKSASASTTQPKVKVAALNISAHGGLSSYVDVSSMSTSPPSTCTTCGKHGGDLKKCNGCKSVKYCGRACQAANWPSHKRECKKRAAEMRDAELFRQPPSADCPICCLRLPLEIESNVYQPCCGQILCGGCMYTHVSQESSSGGACPFCRKSLDFNEGPALLEQLEKRMQAGDPHACNKLAGRENDIEKQLKLLFQAAELGSLSAHCDIGYAYMQGEGLEKDEMKGIHHYQIAAIGGCDTARWNLASFEKEQRGDSEETVSLSD